MPPWLKAIFRYAGYTAFFLVAFVAFVWLTLPLDAVRDLLVRKAADEHNMDLEIADLDTWGLSGLEAAGVVIRPRPTAEERAAMETARKAREDWEKRSKSPPPAAPPPVATDGGVGEELGAIPEPEPGAEVAAAAPPSAAEDKPPPMPEGPRPIFVDELRVRMGLLALLGGTYAGRVEAKLIGGELETDFSRSREALKVAGRWSALDLRQLEALRRHVPLPIAGAFGGEVDVEVSTNDAGALKPASARGHIDLKVSGATVGPGRIESDKLGAFPYFDVPKVNVDELGGRLALDKRKAVFENFKITGKDVEGEITGYVQLADKFDRWGPRSHLRFKFSDEFMEKNKDVKLAMNNIGYIKRGQLDGYTGFSITGTFQRPQFQPRKRSPYADSAGRRVAAGAADEGDEEAGTGAEGLRRPSGSARLARDRARFGKGADAEEGDEEGSTTGTTGTGSLPGIPPIRTDTNDPSNDPARHRTGRPFVPPTVLPSPHVEEPIHVEPEPPPPPLEEEPPPPLEIPPVDPEPEVAPAEPEAAGGGEQPATDEPTEDGEPE